MLFFSDLFNLRQVTITAGLVFPLLLSGGCSREPASAEACTAVDTIRVPAKRQPLRWMGHWKGEGGRERLVREVLSEFSFLHPELDVQFEFAANLLPSKSQRAAGQLIAEMIRSGKLEWDVIWLDPLIYRFVARELGDAEWGRKHLVDFSEVPGFAETQQPFLVSGAEAHQFTGGVFVGPYIEGFYCAMWYNARVADRIGLHIQQNAATFEELLGYAEKVRQHNQTAETPVETFLDWEGSVSPLRLFCSLYLSLFPEERLAQLSAAEKTAAIQKVYAAMSALGARGVLSGETRETPWVDAARRLTEGQALFYFDATWLYSVLEELELEGLQHLRMAPMPILGDEEHVVGGYISTWAVLKHAPGREAGIELLRYWSRPSMADKWIRYTKSPTGLRGSLYDPKYSNDQFAAYQRRLREEHERIVMDPLMISDDRMPVGDDWASNVLDALLGNAP